MDARRLKGSLLVVTGNRIDGGEGVFLGVGYSGTLSREVLVDIQCRRSHRRPPSNSEAKREDVVNKILAVLKLDVQKVLPQLRIPCSWGRRAISSIWPLEITSWSDIDPFSVADFGELFSSFARLLFRVGAL